MTATQYYSESRKVWVEIASLNDYHLVAAYNKQARLIAELGEEAGDGMPDTELGIATRDALKAELDRRGLDPRFKSGKRPEEVQS